MGADVGALKAVCHAGLMLGFEIELDLHIVRVVEEICQRVLFGT